ncbi:MAG: translation initiation factor IF-2, partial [Bacteroidota bacterium]
MSEERTMRLSQVARKLNVGLTTIVDFLAEKGFEVDSSPNSKVTGEQFTMLSREFAASAHEKEEASGLTIGTKIETETEAKPAEPVIKPRKQEEENILIKNLSVEKKDVEPEPEPAEKEKVDQEKPKLKGLSVVGKIDLDKKKEGSKEKEAEAEATGKEKTDGVQNTASKKESEQPEPAEVHKAKADKLQGLKVVGKIDLPKEKEKQPVASSDKKEANKKKRPRKRIARPGTGSPNQGGRPNQNKGRFEKEEPSDKEIQDKIKATLAKLSGGKKKGGGAKYRREKRSAIAEAKEEQMLQEQEESKLLKVTEFIAANDLASLMNVSVNDVISTCMSLGMFVSINQRLDAESITVIADEFGYNVEFTSTDDEADVVEEEDSAEDLDERAPIVTIMGHVDHGKTSLLDYIRSSKVTAGEAGGITQHIGAYDVMTDSGNKIAFLDTPGHEAFTAMRARGAKVTDIVIIVVAADDDVMPQTKEAINHAQVAGVPIVIAINKIDKPNANADKVRESLSSINILVEEWGGKYQSQEISAKTGQGVEELLEKVLLEAELLELTANHTKKAVGTVIEASLDKGRGYVATLLVQNGTMNIGDVILAGAFYGRVKAMFDHKGKKLKEAGPATPVLLLGLDG